MKKYITILMSIIGFSCLNSYAQTSAFKPIDVFELEYAADPEFSADGKSIVYVRNFMDIMKDRKRSNLWRVDFDGKNHRPITSGLNNYASPRFSPDGTRIAFIANENGKAHIYVKWLKTGEQFSIAQLQKGIGSLTWSPNSEMIAFTQFVATKNKPYITLPTKPKGAEWEKEATIYNELKYRSDGSGDLEHGNKHVFVVPALGGTPRQLTFGEFNHKSVLSWSRDGSTLYFSANRHDNHAIEVRDTEIYSVELESGKLTELTNRFGPDNNPVVSPDGKKIAFTGYDDKRMGYHNEYLYVMNVDGSDRKALSDNFDRSINSFYWGSNSKEIFFEYTDKGSGNIGKISLSGKVTKLVSNVGGLSFGRPYNAGSFAVNKNSELAFTLSNPLDPSNIAVASRKGGKSTQITDLNSELLNYRTLGTVEEIWYKSSHDGTDIQGWLVKPADFDPKKKYPLILEIHGGPFLGYGPNFAAEFQLMANAGYMVLYTNPRGSKGYGAKFANLIHHDYPGNDYHDLMSGVDHVISMGNVDENRLYVTGGSGGGVLTAWIIGKTNRFKAAAVTKAVVNWTSAALYSDVPFHFSKYWFGAMPWEDQENYWRRSPLSLVGNVSTPTMIVVGELDARTPLVESEQYYQALKMREIETKLVRMKGAFHNISARPSNMISKTLHIIKWFDEHK
ncbi:prolyl oligopeptidase family serine peptidase [Colwellia sp. RE-S-Sl-9]